MKLCASNIAWEEKDDHLVYSVLNSLGFHGLEIAPTRWISETPYLPQNAEYCKQVAINIQREWDLRIVSMQSIWFGRSENIFGSEQERESIYEYMCKAIDFAHTICCPHLVLGCPKNRNITSDDQISNGIELIKKFAQYADRKNVIIGLEANPKIYGTNFINTNIEAEALIRDINLPSLKLNLDFGAMIENGESIDTIVNCIDIVSHVHISEPYLNKIVKRDEHKLLADALMNANYQGYVSLEMKKHPLSDIIETVEYLHDVF